MAPALPSRTAPSTPTYFLSSDDPSSPGPDAIAVTQDPTPNSGTTGWTPDTATSKWITVGSGANVGNPDMYTYSYATTFTLSAADASTASLSGIWACDDSCSMQLNGTPVATYPVPAWTAQPFAIAAGSPFRAGANTLTVVVSNSGAYATGLQIVSIQGSVGAPAPLAPPQDGLVGWWTFDDPGPIVRDASGHGNDGLAQGNLTQVPGRVGQAYALAGGCIGVPSSPSLAMAGGNQVTMMAWVEPATECSDTVAPGNCEFLNKENTYEMAQGAGTGSGGDPASQSVLGGFGEAIQRSDGYWFWNEQQPNVIAVGTWQHVAVTWDGTTVTRYLDGAVLVDPSNPRALDSSLTFAGNDTGLGIGCRDVAPDGTITLAAEGAFTGIVDEAAVYDRALSPAEIAAYYAATR